MQHTAAPRRGAVPVDGRYTHERRCRASGSRSCASAPPADLAHLEATQQRRADHGIAPRPRRLRRRTPPTRASRSTESLDGVVLHVSGRVLVCDNTTVYGDNNDIRGNGNTAIGSWNTLTGAGCRARGDNNRVTGRGASAWGYNNIVVGPGATSVTYRFSKPLAASAVRVLLDTEGAQRLSKSAPLRRAAGSGSPRPSEPAPAPPKHRVRVRRRRAKK